MRSDFHLEAGEEFFFQLEGTVNVKVVHKGKIRDVEIHAGEVFLLPARVPHSPNRSAGGVGLVMERQRRQGERDGLMWFTENGEEVLYQEWFTCTDLGKDLKPIIERFHNSEESKTGERSSSSLPLPKQELEIVEDAKLNEPFLLDNWIDNQQLLKRKDQYRVELFPPNIDREFVVQVIFGATCLDEDNDESFIKSEDFMKSSSEVFIMIVRGDATLEIHKPNRIQKKKMAKKDLFLIPEGVDYRLMMSPQAAALELLIRPPKM